MFSRLLNRVPSGNLWLAFAFAWLTMSVSQAQNHSQVFFDATGSDQAGFGANQIITISGNLTFYGRNDPKPRGTGVKTDFVQPASDVYIMRHGYYHGSGTPGLQLLLKDVSEAPNTILGLGGGGFFEQTIAATHPQGSLVSGEYDIIIDEHQNGAFEPTLDLYLGVGAPALVIKVPFDAPSLPNSGISAMKLRAIQQFQSAALLNEAFKVVSDVFNGPKGQLLGLVTERAVTGNLSYKQLAIREGVVRVYKLFEEWTQQRDPLIIGRAASFMNQPFDAAVNAIENSMKRQTGLAADPPDPNFAQVVLLPPKSAHLTPSDDPWINAIGTLAVAIDNEDRLQSALLAALEKYEGAREAKDGRWCLAHARAISHFATLLAEQWQRSENAVNEVKNALAVMPFDLEAFGTALASIQQDIARDGLPPEIALALAETGISTSNANFLSGTFTFSREQFIAALDAKLVANAESGEAFHLLATEMESIVAAIEADPTIDLGDPVIDLPVPEEIVEAGMPLRLSATGTDAYLEDPLLFEWDLDGDGLFNDGEGPTIDATLVSGTLIGVRGTNGADRFSVAYAPVDALPPINVNQRPQVTGATPESDDVAVATDAVQGFSIDAIDPEGTPVTIRWVLDGEITGSGPSFAFQAPSERGLRLLTAELEDSSGAKASHSWMIRVTQPASLADLALSIEAPDSPATVGEEFTWTITVENNGPSAAENVVVTQTLPAELTYVRGSASFGNASVANGSVTANLGTIEKGGLAMIWVQTTAAQAGTFTSSGAVGSIAADMNGDNNTATARVRATDPAEAIADLVLIATVNPSPAVLGSSQTLTFVIENKGPDGATGALLETQLPESVAFVSATPAALSVDDGFLSIALDDLASGQSRTVVVRVTPLLTGSGPAFARVTSAMMDTDFSNNETSVLLSAITAPPPVADLTIVQTPPGETVRVGLPATWTITVTNNGPDPAEHVTVLDRFPAGAHFINSSPSPDSLGNGQAAFVVGTLASGESRSLDIVIEPQFPGEFTNIASAISDSHDPEGAPTFASELVSYEPTFSGGIGPVHPNFIDPLSALGAPDYTGNLNPGSVSLGSGGRITLRFIDSVLTGSGDATPDLHIYEVGDGVEDTFVEISSDGITWHSVGKVFGSTSLIDIDAFGFSLNDWFSFVRLTDDPNEGSPTGETVGADIDAVGVLQSGAVSSSSVRVEEAPTTSADLSTAIAADNSGAGIGENVTFTITLANAGPDSSTDVISTTRLPEGLTFVSATSSQGTATHENGLIRVSLPSLAPDDSGIITILANVTAPRLLAVITEVSSSDRDPVKENNRAVSADLTASIALIHNRNDAEIPKLQEYLAEMGLVTQLFNGLGLEPTTLEPFQLIIWDDLSYAGGGVDAPLVDTFQAVADAGKPLYFIGDDLAYVTDFALTEPQATLWSDLIHLQPAGNGSSGVMTIINTTHPVTNGVFGPVGDSAYLWDTDPSHARGLPGEVILGKFTTYDSLIAYQDPATGRKSVTQNELVFTQVATAAGQQERKKLFKNAVTWLLSDDKPTDIAVTQFSPSEVAVGTTFKVSLTVTNKGPNTASVVTITDQLPGELEFVSATADHGAVTHTEGLVTVALGTLAVGESTRIEMILAAQEAGLAEHTVRAGSLESESSPADNRATRSIAISPEMPARLMATYHFEDTLAPCEPDVAPLQIIDPSKMGRFVTMDLDGHMRRIYHWDGQNAFSMIPPDSLLRDQYSLEFLFRFIGATNTARSLVDVSDGNGLSLDAEGHLQIGTHPPGGDIAEGDRFHHVVLTVGPGGNVTTYLNGRVQSTLTGTEEMNITDGGLLHFFPSDATETSGEIALLRVYAGVLPHNRVAAQAAYPFGPSEPMKATQQFSGTFNPSGVWTYGYSTTRGTPFIVSTNHAELEGQGNLENWDGTPLGPHIIRNIRDHAVSYLTIILPPDLLDLSPGHDGRNPVLRWTAPAGGRYRVQGRFQGVDTNPNGTDVAVLKNGDVETTLFEDYVLGYESRKPFDVTVSLAMGETVDFSVGAGGNSNLFDSTGVDAVVTPLELTDDCASGTDLRITQSIAPSMAVRGEPIALTLNVTNEGPYPASGVVLSDTLEPGLEWLETSGGDLQTQVTGNSISLSLGTLAVWENRQITLLMRATHEGSFTHAARVFGATFDPAPANNSTQGTVVVEERIQLVATVRSASTEAVVGAETAFELVAANASRLSADAVLRVDLPPGAEFVSASDAILPEGNQLVFPMVSIGSGEVVSRRIILRPTLAGFLTLQAEVNAPNDSNARPGSGSLTLPVVESAPPADVRVTIAADPAQPIQGCALTVTYTLENLSPTPARAVHYATTVPASSALISASASSGETTVSGRNIVATFPEIVQGTPESLTVILVPLDADPVLLGGTVEGANGNNVRLEIAQASGSSPAVAITETRAVNAESILTLRLETDAGIRYVVQDSDDLEHWRTFPESFEASGFVEEWSDLSAAFDGFPHFYRVVSVCQEPE